MVAMMAYATAPTADLDPASDTPSDPNEPMCEVQAVRLRELCALADEPFVGTLTKGQAREMIETLEKRFDQPSAKLYRS
jgi:hypothetical protein